MGIGGNMGHDIVNYSDNKRDHMKMKRRFSFSKLL